METAPRSLKEKQRQEREALILQVAEEVLMEKGYYETSIDEIASRVGIAKGTVYLHFPGKEDLVIAIFLREIGQLLNRVDEIISSEKSAEARIKAILSSMYGTAGIKRIQFLNSLHNSSDAPRNWKEQHGQELITAWEPLAARISDVLEQGKAAGEFAADIPTPIMLSTFFNLMSPRSYERLIVEGKIEGNELATCLGRIYFRGIATTERE